MIKAPIPGESLTREPGNSQYEKPPEMEDVIDAARYHLEYLSEDVRLDAAMQALEADLSIQTVVEGLTRKAVAEGKHSIDVSVLVAPVIHEFIKTSADAIGVEYDEGEGFSDPDIMEYQEEVGRSRAYKGFDPFQKSQSMEEEPMEEEEVEEMPAPSEGLMARPRGV